MAFVWVTTAHSPPKRLMPDALASASLLKTHLTSLGSLPSAFHRVVQRSAPPSTSPVKPTPTHRSGLRTCAAKRRSRSAYVVSHHLDGLLLHRLHELLTSRCRPWGSPDFHPRRTTCRWPVGQGVPTDASPSRALPSREAVPTSPQAAAPSSSPDCRPTDLEALLLSRVRCIAAPLPDCRCPWLSWASRSGAVCMTLPIPLPEGRERRAPLRFHRRPEGRPLPREDCEPA
jgi:hypothetical protein